MYWIEFFCVVGAIISPLYLCFEMGVWHSVVQTFLYTILTFPEWFRLQERLCLHKSHPTCRKNGCGKRRRENAMVQESARCLASHDFAAIPIAGINTHMMFHHLVGRRDPLQFCVDFIFHLMPSPWHFTV